MSFGRLDGSFGDSVEGDVRDGLSGRTDGNAKVLDDSSLDIIHETVDEDVLEFCPFRALFGAVG